MIPVPADAIRLEGIFLNYRWRRIEKTVFSDLNLNIARGSFTTITGDNGSGKSSLLKLILGVLVPQKGRIYLDGAEVIPGEPRTLAEANCAYLPQNPIDFFLGESVKEELEIATDQQLDRIRSLAEVYALNSLLHRRIRTLSGGERQRLALASFFGPRSAFLLLDEPSSFLDRSNSRLLRNSLESAHAQGATILHVSQYPDEVSWGQQHVQLSEGSLHEGSR